MQRNLTNFNGGIGLYFAGANAFLNSVGRNYADSNGIAGPPPCGPAFPDFCDDTGSFITQSDNVALVPCDIGWSDVGSWDAIHDIADKDPSEDFFFTIEREAAD